MAMAAAAKKSSGADSAIGAIGGMLPGVGGQLAKVSQIASNPKGAMQDFGKQAVKKIAKEVGKKLFKKLAQKAVMSPHFWIGVAIVLGILTWIAFFLTIFGVITGQQAGGGFSATSNQPGQSIYTFVALGDSLTAWPNGKFNYTPNGTPKPETTNDNSGTPWPSQIAAEDQSLQLVKNAGVPTETTTQILSRFTKDVAAYNPDVLFMLGGTNDTGKGIDTIGNIKQIVSNAKSAGIKKVILLTIPHQCPNGSFTALNNQIKRLASSDVAVIDINNALTCGSEYQTDGLHFTNLGAKTVADYIDSQIKSQNILPTKSSNAFHFYCQYDPAYNTDKSACNLQHLGCGVTSTAMVVTTFGDIYTPKDLGLKYGYGCTRPTLPSDVAKALGSLGYIHQTVYIPSNGKINPNTVKSLTDNGFYVIAGACMTCRGCSGPTGHTTVITGVNNNGTFEDADPTYCSSDAHYDMRTLDPTYPGTDVKDGCPEGGGWYWAYATKKQ